MAQKQDLENVSSNPKVAAKRPKVVFSTSLKNLDVSSPLTDESKTVSSNYDPKTDETDTRIREMEIPSALYEHTSTSNGSNLFKEEKKEKEGKKGEDKVATVIISSSSSFPLSPNHQPTDNKQSSNFSIVKFSQQLDALVRKQFLPDPTEMNLQDLRDLGLALHYIATHLQEFEKKRLSNPNKTQPSHLRETKKDRTTKHNQWLHPKTGEDITKEMQQQYQAIIELMIAWIDHPEKLTQISTQDQPSACQTLKDILESLNTSKLGEIVNQAITRNQIRKNEKFHRKWTEGEFPDPKKITLQQLKEISTALIYNMADRIDQLVLSQLSREYKDPNSLVGKKNLHLTEEGQLEKLNKMEKNLLAVEQAHVNYKILIELFLQWKNNPKKLQSIPTDQLPAAEKIIQNTLSTLHAHVWSQEEKFRVFGHSDPTNDQPFSFNVIAAPIKTMIIWPLGWMARWFKEHEIQVAAGLFRGMQSFFMLIFDPGRAYELLKQEEIKSTQAALIVGGGFSLVWLGILSTLAVLVDFSFLHGVGPSSWLSFEEFAYASSIDALVFLMVILLAYIGTLYLTNNNSLIPLSVENNTKTLLSEDQQPVDAHLAGLKIDTSLKAPPIYSRTGPLGGSSSSSTQVNPSQGKEDPISGASNTPPSQSSRASSPDITPTPPPPAEPATGSPEKKRKSSDEADDPPTSPPSSRALTYGRNSSEES